MIMNAVRHVGADAFDQPIIGLRDKNNLADRCSGRGEPTSERGSPAGYWRAGPQTTLRGAIAILDAWPAFMRLAEGQLG